MRNYKWLYKFILASIKNPNFEIYSRFNATEFLTPNRDWDWNYECAKTDRVQELISLILENGGTINKKKLKSICKKLNKNTCFYEEFEKRAKYLTKKLKEDKSK